MIISAPKIRTSVVLIVVATLALYFVGCLVSGARAQQPMSTPSAAVSTTETQAGARWAQLTPRQQIALTPLNKQWDALGDAHRRKWLALSNNFSSMSPQDQVRLHERMTEWAGLTAQQRSQARLVFAETKKLAPDDRKMQWEAYQTLSEDEKRKLASGAAPQPIGAATAVKPISPSKLAVVPIPIGNPINPPRVPLVTLAPRPAVVQPPASIRPPAPSATAVAVPIAGSPAPAGMISPEASGAPAGATSAP